MHLALHVAGLLLRCLYSLLPAAPPQLDHAQKAMNDALCNAAVRTTGEAVATDRQVRFGGVRVALRRTKQHTTPLSGRSRMPSSHMLQPPSSPLRTRTCHHPQGIMLLDACAPRWSIQLVNDAWQRTTGLSSSLAAGANFWDLFEPPPLPQLQVCACCRFGCWRELAGR